MMPDSEREIGAAYATLLSARGRLRIAAAARLMQAIEAVTASGVLTPDLGGTATTVDVTKAVCDRLRASGTQQQQETTWTREASHALAR